jgi:hypothetical protein
MQSGRRREVAVVPRAGCNGSGVTAVDLMVAA